MLFHNRVDAGNQLASELKKFSIENPLVIALPRGGVPVGKAIADRLHAPLDVLIVRKIGYPSQPELGVGAITEGGLTLFNEQLMRQLHLKKEMLTETIQRETKEIHRRVASYRGGRPSPMVKNRNVVLVDDGLATGFTAAAAAKYLKENGAKSVVLAIPVGAHDSVKLLETYVDQVICLQKPEPFFGVGMWYEDFNQTSDQEVSSILQNSSSNKGAA